MDFLNQATIIAVMGYFGFLFKDIPSQILSMIIPKFVTSITVDNQIFMAYNGFSKWLLEQDMSKVLVRHLKTDANFDEFSNTIGEGSYWIRFAPLTIVHVTVISNTNSSGSGGINGVVYKTIATFYGKDQKKFVKSWNSRLKNMFPTHDLLNLQISTSTHITFSHCPKKSFDDVFTPFNDELKAIIDKFIMNADVYKEHGVYYKIGFLFYGPPGTGKSTIARAIASYLNWGVYVINSMSDDLDVDTIGARKVIIIEDIDCFVGNRSIEKRSNVASDNTQAMSLDVLLNFLDGTSSPNQCILVATTNYIEKVDSAILRPGRFDYKFHVDFMDKELAKTMCDRYKVEYEILDQFNFPISPAEIQNEIFLLKNKNQGGTDDDIRA